MEMEDHHHHHHHHHEQPQYTIADLRQLVNEPRSSHFPSLPSQPTAELFPGSQSNLAASHHQHYEMMMFGRQVPDIMPRCLHDFASTDSAAAATNTSIAVATPTTTSAVSTPPLSCLEAETAGCLGLDASTGRWPRQETLTLLEIRSRLDPKFKEANQKGPLWDEVSRIMSEEHGYQRSGKKCREKFENLYKYYKKTKEGKAGRQDGKHYRFFRQLEALYGGSGGDNPTSLPETSTLRFQTPSSHTNNPEAFHSHSLSLTNSTDFDTSSSDGNEEVELEKRRSNKRSWKAKIKSFIDSQMRKLVEKQEEWLEKLTKTLEDKEKERMIREEEWRRQEALRIEREHKFWAKERAWIEARDAALMEALQKLTGSEINKNVKLTAGIIQNKENSNNNNQNEDSSDEILNSRKSWTESEITRLVQLRAEIETSDCSNSEEAMWEEIANKMACFGYERSALVFKEKWKSMSNYNNNKKRKENSRGCFYFENTSDPLYNNQGGVYCDVNDQRQPESARLHSNHGSSPSNSNVGTTDSCFPFLISEGGNLWENYGLKVNKTNQS